MRIEVRSRTGNAVLGVLGGLYLVLAIVLFAYDLMETWGAASMTDRAVQAGLIISALASVLFILIALQNLGLRPASRHAAPLHREGAAIAP
jgi:F0F1-type ATP synthase assembly protein I